MRRRALAVIGSGVAGLSAAYVLQGGADVTLYEADERLGDHAHTHELTGASGGAVRVDPRRVPHPDQALRLLAGPTRQQQQVLGAFDYSVNPTVMHTDTTVLPPARRPRH